MKSVIYKRQQHMCPWPT